MSTTATALPRLQTKQRIVSIQVCRGLAAMLVVLAHLHNLEHKYFSTNYLGIVQFGDLGVDIFFVISGIVISTVTAGKFRDPGKALSFLYHRLARIYPIYWIYSAAILAAYLYNPLWVNASGGHHIDVWQSFFLIPTRLPMLLLQGWTLTFEIYFYLVFFVLLYFCPARLVPAVLVTWAVLVLVLSNVVPHINPVVSVLISPAMLEFLAGCLIFNLYQRAFLHPSIGGVFIGSSVLWLVCIIGWTKFAHGSDAAWIEDSTGIRVALYGVFATFFLMGLMELERSKFVSFAIPFVAIGDWSYSIYLSHTIVLKVFCHYFARFFPHVWAIIIPVALVSLPAVILVGYLSFRFLERPLIALLYARGKPAVTSSRRSL